MNATINTTYVEQTANELLGTPAKKLYYLVISTPQGALTINVGEKTHDQVKKITEKLTEQIKTHQEQAEEIKKTNTKAK